MVQVSCSQRVFVEVQGVLSTALSTTLKKLATEGQQVTPEDIVAHVKAYFDSNVTAKPLECGVCRDLKGQKFHAQRYIDVEVEKAKREMQAKNAEEFKRPLLQITLGGSPPEQRAEAGPSGSAGKAPAAPAGGAAPKEAPAPSADLPPPSTYAQAVLRALNAQKGREARADKLNRQKMAKESEEAAAKRAAAKEAYLSTKYREGYLPLADRKKIAEQRTAKKGKKNDKAAAPSVVEAAACDVRKFVRWTHAQMRKHQAAVLQQTGGERWFSAAERAAYKLLPASEKARLRAENLASRQKKSAEQAKSRQTWRKEAPTQVSKDALVGAGPHFGGSVAGGCKRCKLGKAIPGYLCQPCAEKVMSDQRIAKQTDKYYQRQSRCAHGTMRTDGRCKDCGLLILRGVNSDT